MKPTDQQLAIFAGAGELPLIAARNARAKNIPFVVYHIVEADLNSELLADAGITIRRVSLGSVAQTFIFLKEDNIKQTILLGKVEKQRLLQDVVRDAEAEAIYAKVPDRRDDTLFLEFARALAAMHIEILPQKSLLEGCFLSKGNLTHKSPESSSLVEDIEFGYELSRKIGSLDVGQTAIVFQKMILAVEAIEGTDAAIIRAGEISRKKGGVVCKTAKASQDARFDLPAVGTRTLETMAASGMQALVIEAEQTLVVDPKSFIAKANTLGLIVIAR